jgi:hypothetical protein
LYILCPFCAVHVIDNLQQQQQQQQAKKEE